MKKLISTLFALSFVFAAVAQEENNGHWCGTDQMHQEHVKENPEAIKAATEKLDKLAYQMLQEANGTASYKNYIDDGRPFVIPVVVHVFYMPGSTPMRAEQVDGLIEGLNNRYSPSDADQAAAKNKVHEDYIDAIGYSNIKFVLASKDPQGNETIGITFNEWEHADGSAANRNEVKYQNIWDPSRYLNFWVVDRIGSFSDNPNQQILGFAQFPTDYAAGAWATDGVVIRKDQVNRSSTTGPHEVGHYLGLYHPFQGDIYNPDSVKQGCVTGDCHFAGDRICDIDQAFTASWQTCPANMKHPDSCPLDDRPDPVNNYMMYTNDACHCMFSKEQVVRMRSTLLSYRYKLSSWANVQSVGIGDLTGNQIVYDVNVYPNPFEDNITLQVESDRDQEICISIKDLLGRTVQKDCKKKLGIGRNSITLSANDMNISERGVYLLELQLVDKIIVTKIQYGQ
ncbi:MAG: zinc-dependent metalloprotease [Bacteroidetes bacterium]|nr:zinc-dependent metalloprotease [Bacteroidota bacterium]